MEDEVLVQPVRTYLEGSDLKQPHDEPYRVGRWRARELKANGLVEYDDTEAKALEAPQAAESAPEAPEPQKQRGRRSSAA